MMFVKLCAVDKFFLPTQSHSDSCLHSVYTSGCFCFYNIPVQLLFLPKNVLRLLSIKERLKELRL